MYQVSLQGEKPTQKNIQLDFKNAQSLKEAKEIAAKFKLEYRKHLLGEEYIPKNISLLFSDRAQAITDGIPEKEITDLWPHKPEELYCHVLYQFD